ncbi:hypothetical protein K8I28_13425 [bacterium]|nr:hypothetical protein [bacterium]
MEYFNTYNFDSAAIAVLVLSFIAGLAIVNVFSSTFSRFLVSITIFVILVISLSKGHSHFIENLTSNLSRYFGREPVGLFGFIIGFVVGAALRKKR